MLNCGNFILLWRLCISLCESTKPFINVLLLLLIPLTYKSWIYFIFISFNVLFLAWQLGHVSGSFTSSPAFADPQDSRTPPSSAEPGFEGPLFSDLSLWILLHDHNLFKGLLKTSLWLGKRNPNWSAFPASMPDSMAALQVWRPFSRARQWA